MVDVDGDSPLLCLACVQRVWERKARHEGTFRH